MNATIRKARPEELKIIQSMNHRLFLWDFDRDPALNVNWPLEAAGESYFAKKISGETGVCFVAEQDGKLLGYVAGRVDNEVDKTDTLLRSELENIYVEEPVRSQGIGRLMTQEFMRWATKNGAQSMFVTAYYGNEDAIEFYKSCGFNPFALKLEKKLDVNDGKHA